MKSLSLFLFGLFSVTHVKVIGYMPITELFCFMVAPIIFFQDMQSLKRHGFFPLLMLALLTMVGCVIACWSNESPTYVVLRGLTTTYATFAVPVVAHRLLMRDLSGVKWYFIGGMLSAIITIWILKPGYEDFTIATRGLDSVKNQGLYYAAHFGPLATLPLYAFYLNIPISLSLLAVSIPTFQSVLTTATGRSAVLLLVVCAAVIAVVGKKVSKMRKFKKHLFAMMGLGCFLGVGIGFLYKYAGSHGLLSEAQQSKYERQVASKGKDAGFLSMIVSGRCEFFMGMFAAFDNPIIGLGPLPLDKKEYIRTFYERFGTAQEVSEYMEYREYLEKNGVYERVVPIHSAIICHWVYYGIFGLLFWLFFLKKFYEMFRHHIDAVPQWFGYFVYYGVNFLWGLMFSPFAGRVDWGMFVTMLLMAIAIGKGRVRLPYAMYIETLSRAK